MSKKLHNLLDDILKVPLNFDWIRRDVTYWSLDGKKLAGPLWNESCIVDEENWDTFEDFEKYGGMFIKVTPKNDSIVLHKQKGTDIVSK